MGGGESLTLVSPTVAHLSYRDVLAEGQELLPPADPTVAFGEDVASPVAAAPPAAPASAPTAASIAAAPAAGPVAAADTTALPAGAAWAVAAAPGQEQQKESAHGLVPSNPWELVPDDLPLMDQPPRSGPAMWDHAPSHFSGGPPGEGGACLQGVVQLARKRKAGAEEQEAARGQEDCPMAGAGQGYPGGPDCAGDPAGGHAQLQALQDRILRSALYRRRPVVVLLVGPAGSGKSTLARLVAQAMGSAAAAGQGQQGLPVHLLAPPSSHACTRRHGVGFIEVIPAGPPRMGLGASSSLVDWTASCPTFSGLGRTGLRPQAQAKGGECPLVLVDPPGILGAGGGGGQQAWQQQHAEASLAHWLQHGAALGDHVLLQPKPPLAELLTKAPDSLASGGPQRWVPDGAVVVLSAEDVLARLGVEDPKESGSTADGGRGALERLVGVLMLRLRGMAPPVVLTNVDRLKPQQQAQVWGFITRNLGLTPGLNALALPPLPGGLGACNQPSAAEEIALKAVAYALDLGAAPPPPAPAADGTAPSNATSAQPGQPAHAECSLASLWAQLRDALFQNPPPELQPLVSLLEQAVAYLQQPSVQRNIRRGVVIYFVLLGVTLLLACLALLCLHYLMKAEPHHRQSYFYRSKTLHGIL